jgi:hypothetical protein
MSWWRWLRDSTFYSPRVAGTVDGVLSRAPIKRLSPQFSREGREPVVSPTICRHRIGKKCAKHAGAAKSSRVDAEAETRPLIAQHDKNNYAHV